MLPTPHCNPTVGSTFPPTYSNFQDTLMICTRMFVRHDGVRMLVARHRLRLMCVGTLQFHWHRPIVGCHFIGMSTSSFSTRSSTFLGPVKNSLLMSSGIISLTTNSLGRVVDHFELTFIHRHFQRPSRGFFFGCLASLKLLGNANGWCNAMAGSFADLGA